MMPKDRTRLARAARIGWSETHRQALWNLIDDDRMNEPENVAIDAALAEIARLQALAAQDEAPTANVWQNRHNAACLSAASFALSDDFNDRQFGNRLLKLLAEVEVANPHPPAAAQDEAQGWQPIETAPKDGTHLLVCDARRAYTASWGFGQNPPTVGHYFQQGWHLSVNRDGEQSEISPTHWRPLPAPPDDPKET